VRSDIALSRGLLKPGGIVAFDDARNVPALKRRFGQAVTVEARANLLRHKLYGELGSGRKSTTSRNFERHLKAPVGRLVTHRVAGHDFSRSRV